MKIKNCVNSGIRGKTREIIKKLIQKKEKRISKFELRSQCRKNFDRIYKEVIKRKINYYSIDENVIEDIMKTDDFTLQEKNKLENEKISNLDYQKKKIINKEINDIKEFKNPKTKVKENIEKKSKIEIKAESIKEKKVNFPLKEKEVNFPLKEKYFNLNINDGENKIEITNNFQFISSSNGLVAKEKEKTANSQEEKSFKTTGSNFAFNQNPIHYQDLMKEMEMKFDDKWPNPFSNIPNDLYGKFNYLNHFDFNEDNIFETNFFGLN